MGLFSYVERRVQPGHRRRNLGHALSRARESLTIAKADPAELKGGYEGRYEDGGRARFAEMVAAEGLDEVQIRAMGTHHRVLSIAFLVAALACLAAMVWLLLAAGTMLDRTTGFTLLVVVLAFGAMAFRHHYSAWQIRERRFGGLREFLGHGS